MDDLQKKTAQGIVNIFETGHLTGNYGAVTVIDGDAGHLSYGRSQTSLTSGGLFLLINRYCKTPGAGSGEALRPFLDRLQAADVSLDHDGALRDLLADAGSDPIMRQVQDAFFDENYWAPANRVAQNACKATAVETSLGITVIYDSVIHGSFRALRDRTNSAFTAKPDEKQWVQKYVDDRRVWLAENDNPALRKCVYRMDELKKLIAAEKWELQLPLTVRGVQITEGSFAATATPATPVSEARASAQDSSEPLLSLRTPHQTGPAVEFVQRALIGLRLLHGDGLDGAFGPDTAAAVKVFQRQQGLADDGMVGPATWTALHEAMGT